MLLPSVLLALVLGSVLLVQGRSWWAFVLGGVSIVAGWGLDRGELDPAVLTVLAVGGALAAITGIPALRRVLVTGPSMRLVAPLLPRMSETERVALEAGTVWWDGELFSGRPDWDRLARFEPVPLTDEEQRFLDEEVETICRMTDNERVDELGDLPPEVWSYLKSKRFMGLIIPREYGGLDFSARAVSEIITRCSSHNVTLAVTVMLPSSLGPAELLLHYGTEEQKKRWLPRLARGEEVPAFALTEPFAGSDAGSLSSRGVVCRGQWNGQEVLGVRLDWNKRYITLAPVASLLGVAFQLEDPEGLLGEDEHRGITLALVPTSLPGVETRRRHDPLGVKFINGPTTGRDVFVPLDHVIGGAAQVGKGWRMLMDCLSAGRSLCLPGLACGAAQTTLRTVTSYGMVREQFGMPIARFEGVEEKLSRIAGDSWWMDAARELTAASVAAGEKPAVLSAIMKAWTTEAMRDVVNEGMDVLAGAAICRGRKNVLAGFYQALPIGITVEGANVLTRTLIVFGQGALRCHPFAFAEVDAVQQGDRVAFDRAFAGHIGHTLATAARATATGWTAGLLGSGRTLPGRLAWGSRHVTRLSAAFALVSEASMITLGADLKRKERLTGRLADALAHLYFASAALQRDLRRGSLASDGPYLEWALRTHLGAAEDALLGVLDNLPNRLVATALRVLALPRGRTVAAPDDALAAEVARLALTDADTRERLTHSVHVPAPERSGLGAIEDAAAAIGAVAPLLARVKAAVRSGQLQRTAEPKLLSTAVEAGVLTEGEADSVRHARHLQREAVQVDSFGPEAYRARCGA